MLRLTEQKEVVIDPSHMEMPFFSDLTFFLSGSTEIQMQYRNLEKNFGQRDLFELSITERTKFLSKF